MNINYYEQPTGNTCGPACLKMAHSSIYGLQNTTQITIELIGEMCGTDWIVGTPPERMIAGLTGLGLEYVIHINEENPFELLQKTIDDGKINVLRTLTQGMPHWIIVENYVDDIYNVLDPWLGRLQYTKEQLTEIWSPREYFYFEIYK
jgi:predicted double-glycine peptidase